VPRAATTREERKRLLTFVVVGAGPTGLELAGAIAELARAILRTDFRASSTQDVRVILVEGANRVLPGFAEELSRKAEQALERLGVEVSLGVPVTACDAEGLLVGNRSIDTQTVIWAAGVMASPVADWFGTETDSAGRVVVGPDLTLRSHPEVFLIGDTARSEGADGGALPGTAPVAKQQVPMSHASSSPVWSAATRVRSATPSRQHGDDRPRLCGRGIWPYPAEQISRLVRMGHRPHCVPNRVS
jgi:NADH:ubiquinone reductase (H+-translocating)